MVRSTTSHALFKMVSLRGPDIDKFIDPSSSSNISLKFVHDVNLEERGSNENRKKIREAIASINVLSKDDLNRKAVLADLVSLLKNNPSADLKKEHSLAGLNMVPADLNDTSGFWRNYEEIYNSWLAVKLKNFADLETNTELVDLHRDFIRAAEWVRRSRLSHYREPAGVVVATAHVVYPKVWRQKRAKLPSAHSADVGVRSDKSLKSLISERARKLEELEAINDIQNLIVRSRNIPEIRAVRTLPMTAATAEMLVSNLPTEKQDTARSVLSSAVGVDLSGVLGKLEMHGEVVADSANLLCSQIRVYEHLNNESLPTPRKVNANTRASIRTVGIGDLVVAKETLQRYTVSEIAHIENVMAGEVKVREHERKTMTEVFSESETTEEEFSERNLETSDRFELQTESEKTIEEEFSIEGGVNTSGRYGVTKVETSIDGEFSGSNSSSTRTTVDSAKEIISRTTERINSKVRELRRRTTKEEIRELATHTLANNSADPADPPTGLSGVYYWVDKVEKVQLRHYGTRLMIEFNIPEPGISLIEQREMDLPDFPKPAPFKIGPDDISVHNYKCIAKLYGADGIKAPPSYYMETGISFASTPRDEKENKAEETFEGEIIVPEGYVPYEVLCSVSGRGTTANLEAVDKFNAHVAVAGQEILVESGPSTDWEPSYNKTKDLVDPLMEVGGTGLPVTAMVSAAHDNVGTVNVLVRCYRGSTAMINWQFETYEKIKQAHRSLVEEYNQAKERAQFEEESALSEFGRPPAINRQIEKDELKKWAIKLMRVEHFDFDAIVGLGADESMLQEIDAAAADSQTPIVSFFENSFEWQHMTYFLFPYFWSRRRSWNARTKLEVPGDHKHELFLKSGYARVVVPVAPGMEDRVLGFLSQDAQLPDVDRLALVDAALASSDDIPTDDPLWLEIRANSDQDVALGNGLLKIANTRKLANILSENWKISEIDIGREIFINGAMYTIQNINKENNSFSFSPDFVGSLGKNYSFASGSVPYGEPWEISIPTRLVVLRENIGSLNP